MTFKKYFLAIVIPEPFFGNIEAIKQDLFDRHELKGALRSPCHITLHRPFEWKEDKEQLLIEGLSNFKYSESFPIQLSGFDFFEPRVVFVNVIANDQLNALHFELSRFARKQFRLLNETNDRRGFHPHVTVAFRDLKKPKFYELQQEFKNRSFEAAFPYLGFSLLKLDKRWETRHEFPSTA